MKKTIFLALSLTAAVFFLNACDKAEEIINPYKGWSLYVEQINPPVNPISVSVSSVIFEANVTNLKGEVVTTDVQNLILWGAAVVSDNGAKTDINNKITSLLSGRRVSIGTNFEPQITDKIVVATSYADLIVYSTVTFTN